MRVVCTAGHVDHGKSTLVTALTGQHPDRLAEEQRRGLTIDLGFAWTTLPGVGDVAIVDLPGHERFVPTMLAGAGPVGTALLVVAADEGWMPQSAEHLAILRLLDVRSGVVALSRCDLVDAETVAIARELVAEELAGSGLAGAPIVPVSAVTGAGLDDLRSALADVLRATPPPADEGRPRLWVDRAFSVRGAGTVVTGTLGGGWVGVGDALTAWPGGHAVRVRGVQCLEHPVERGGPGWRVALNLVGVDVAEVNRGTSLARAGQWVRTAEVDAWCTPEGGTLGRRGAWRVHVGTTEVGASLFPAGGSDLVGPGSVRVVLDQPLTLAAGDRVVVRDAGRGRTVGGGVVLDPVPRARPRGRAQRQEAVDRLEALAVAMMPLGTGSGQDGVTAREATREAPIASPGGTATQMAARRLTALVADRDELDAATALAMAGASSAAGADVERVGVHLLSPARWRTLSALVVQAVSGTHQRRPALAVADRSEPRRLAGSAGAPAAVVESVIERVVAEGRLEVAPGGLRVPGWEPRLTMAQGIARTTLLARLDAQGWEVEPLADATAACEADPDLLAALVREGELVPVDGGARALTRAAVVRAAALLAALPQPFTASQAREALGTTRKHALPLLEALDAAGRTRREGDLRRLAR